MRLVVKQSAAEAVPIDSSTSVFIARNAALERLLFNRALVGIDFRRTCLLASRLFLRHLVDEFTSRRIAELMILSKGLVYQLSEAFALETAQNLPTNVVAAVRAGVDGSSAKVEIPYARLDAGGDTLIVGDTIASGSTVIAAIEEYTQQHRLARVYVVSYAGSVVGAKSITSFCQTRAIEVVLLYGLAAFGLGKNGFDLSFLHPETLTRHEYVERARSLYDGKPLSAVGWDFGSQQMAPEKYRSLAWVESKVHDTDDSLFGSLQPVESPDVLWREREAFKDNVTRIWPEGT